MSKNNTNVNVFADSGYAVWTAPSGTSLPSTLPPANPGAAFDEIGLLSDAGITEAHNLNETKIYDMAGSLVRIARNQEERPFTFVALEGNNVVDSLRYPGSSVTSTGTSESQTITISGTPSGGTFTPSLSGFGSAGAQAYNVSTAALQAALRAAWNLAVNVTGTAGTSYVVAFPAAEGDVPQMTVASALTGGSSPTATVTTSTPGTTGINSRTVGAGTGRNLRVWCIDLVDGSTHKRIAINNGEAVWTGTTTYNGSGAALYEFTLQPYKDSNGNYYTILSDDPADAEAFA